MEMEGFGQSLALKDKWNKVNEQMGFLAAFDQLFFNVRTLRGKSWSRREGVSCVGKATVFRLSFREDAPCTHEPAFGNAFCVQLLLIKKIHDSKREETDAALAEPSNNRRDGTRFRTRVLVERSCSM